MPDLSRPVTIAFHTLGCKVNHYETDAAAMRFLDAGFQEVPFDQPADVYLVNTCTVTGEADRKTRQMLRRARSLNPDAVVAAMGCHVETAGAEGLADVRIGCGARERAVELVLAALAGRAADPQDWRPEPPTVPEPSGFEETGPVTRQSETRAYIKIQDGCDDFCAYCAIPFARGRSRSRERGRILTEARALAAAGFAEVVLTGIHIGAYGLDRGEDGVALARLAREIGGVPGIRRVRLGSLEPQTVSAGFLAELKAAPNLCAQFHLSLQSGSRTVLERMGRRYAPEDFAEMVRAIRADFPGAGVTTDIMAGFPGETEEEHRESMAFCELLGFSRMHVFRYSRRKGTRAAQMPGQVHSSVTARRAAELGLVAAELADRFARSLDGKTREVLVEQVDEDGSGTGYTPEYVLTEISGLAAGDAGRILPVRLAYAGNGVLSGRAVSGPPG